MTNSESSLRLGIRAFKSGDRKKARIYLLRAVREEPNNEHAWGWLSNTAETNDEKIHCLQQVVKINPQNTSAQKLLSELEISQIPTSKKPLNAPTTQRVGTNPPSSIFSQMTSSNQGLLILGMGTIILLLLCVVVYLVYPRSSRKQESLPEPTIEQPVSSGLPGTILVNNWRFVISEIRTDRGKDPSRKMVVLIGNLYNEGRASDTFTPSFTMLLRDSSGREYDDDYLGTVSATDKYGGSLPSGVNPGAHVYVAFAYDVPASEYSFLIVPGDLATSWGGNYSFGVR